MLEYFTYRKVKKNREEKAAEKLKQIEDDMKKEKEAKAAAASSPSAENPKIISTPADRDTNQRNANASGDVDVVVEGTPILDREDERFLERLTSANLEDFDDENPPPLPPRVKTPFMEIDSDDDDNSRAAESKSEDKVESKDQAKGKGKGKEKETTTTTPSAEFPSTGNKLKRFTMSLRRKPVAVPASPADGLHPNTDAKSKSKSGKQTLAVPPSSTPDEAAKETTEMAHLLDDLDLSAKNNKAFSLSTESAELARRFTQVLKDLINGVPTAYGDLVGLIDDRDGVLARNYERLPSGLKKLVAQLPEKLTGSLGPEILAVAAESQGLAHTAGEGGMKAAAKSMLTPGNLKELVTKPGALVGLLKGIVNALKTRFPAFVGTNVLWSLAVFLLMSMLWYCHKRGREVRLEQEEEERKKAAGETGGDTIEGQPRVEELPDDPMLEGAAATAAGADTAADAPTGTGSTGAVREGAV
ncbi:hypothetical protein F4808DRAFT_421809 [Astrocystis sublimbata]|nr:hypothetical protein F4808DRAFT_421809 [Astrocystis sublimbata]